MINLCKSCSFYPSWTTTSLQTMQILPLMWGHLLFETPLMCRFTVHANDAPVPQWTQTEEVSVFILPVTKAHLSFRTIQYEVVLEVFIVPANAPPVLQWTHTDGEPLVDTVCRGRPELRTPGGHRQESYLLHQTAPEKWIINHRIFLISSIIGICTSVQD